MGVFIIAEIGVNHNGNANTMIELVKSASRCGADACKFQTFNANQLASRETPKVAYQNDTTDVKETHLEMLKKLEMSHEMHLLAIDACAKVGIEFISTPYDPGSVKYLASLGVKKIKTASADVVDHRIHSEIARIGLKPIVAVGMATNDEIEAMLQVYSESTIKPTILHCVSNYPCETKSLNMKCISSMHDRFNVPIGYSDHSVGIGAAILSVALGAPIIERHFTLSKEAPGPDHRASDTPDEFTLYVKAIRQAELAMGSEIKQIQDEEKDMRLVSRKSLRAKNDLAKNHLITEQDLTMMRPGGGLSGDSYYKLIGKKTLKPITAGSQITFNDVR